jgi:hypothetical protein
LACLQQQQQTQGQSSLLQGYQQVSLPLHHLSLQHYLARFLAPYLAWQHQCKCLEPSQQQQAASQQQQEQQQDTLQQPIQLGTLSWLLASLLLPRLGR